MSGLAALATLAGAGVNFASSYINRKTDIALLKYQNEYNSPKNMMKRLAEAGINPNAAAQGIAGSPGYGNMAAADAANVSNAIPSDLGTQIGNSVNSALNAQLVKANIKKVEEETRGMKTANDYEDATFDTRVQQAEDNGVITHANAEMARETAQNYPEMLNLSKEQAYAELDKTKAEKAKLDKELDRIDQEIKESDKRIAKLEQDIKTGKSQEAKNYAEAELTRERTKNQQLLNDKQEMENNREELSGDASGWKAVYFDIMDKDGEDAANKWLNEHMDAVDAVVNNTSKAAAEGSQEVYDATPQGQLKRQLQQEMNDKLAAQDAIISKARKELRNNPGFMRSRYEDDIKYAEKKKEEIRKDYSKRMAQVDKGSSNSMGVNIAGYGVNWHE